MPGPRTGRTHGTAGRHSRRALGLNRPSALERGLDSRPIGLGLGVEEGRLRRRVGVRSRAASRAGRRAPVRPGSASMTVPGSTADRRARAGRSRERARSAGLRQVEWQVRPGAGAGVASVGSRDRGPRKRGRGRSAGRPGGDTCPARRPRRRGSGASPVSPAGRSGCGRRAPRSGGRRRRAQAGPTTGAPARAGCPVDSATAVARPPPSPGASRISRRVSRAARARPGDGAGRRPWPACRSGPVGHRAGRGRADRPSGRRAALPAIERPSSRLAGVMTTSQSRLTPRAAASTGSKLRDEVEPGDDRAVGLGLRDEPQGERRAAARSRSPRIATRRVRGRPPGPRIASSSAKPGPDDPVDAGRGSPGATGTEASPSRSSGRTRPEPAPWPAPRPPPELRPPTGPGEPARAADPHPGRGGHRTARSNICSR